MIHAKLFVLGTERELLSTDLEYYRTRGATTGRPGPIPMGGLVALAFVSGYGDDRLLYALTHSPEGEFCTLTTAKIVFYAGDLDGMVLFEYQLKDAAFVYWKEEFSATGEAPMTEMLTISAAIQEIKGVTWVKPWRESEVFSEESAAREKERHEVASGHFGKKDDDGSIALGVVTKGMDSNIVSKNIRTQKQAAEYVIGGQRLGTKSYLNRVDDAKSVLNATHSGDAKILSTNPSQNRVYVQYDGVKGYYNNNGTIIETNKFLIKGEKSATVVPIHPNTTTFK